jgi:O-antigen/teichoic acid export membrane protein
VPTASRYVATGDERRLRELAVRGSRYTLALFVPLCVTLMALAEPILEVWLGQRYSDGAGALTILVAYWPLYGALVVTPGFLVGVGRAREIARLMVVLAVCNLALALLLTPELGVEGPALATTIPFVLAFPLMLRNGLLATGVPLSELVRRAFAPAYLLGVGLAAALLALRFGLDLEGLAPVALTAIGGVLTYWALFHRLVLDASERKLVSDLVRRAP